MTFQFPKLVKNVVFICMLASSSYATTTTLSFDDATDGNLGGQYQSVGVTAMGAEVIESSQTPWSAHSGAKLVYAPLGLMTFNLDPVITGNIQTVSAYISGVVNTGIFAYDASNNLVGQSVLTASANNVLLSVTTNGAPIVRVEIHDGGATFGVDDFSFVEAEGPAPTCGELVLQTYVAADMLSLSVFKNFMWASNYKRELKKEILVLQKMIADHETTKKLLLEVEKIRKMITDRIKVCAEQSQLLDLLEQIKNQIKAGQC